MVKNLSDRPAILKLKRHISHQDHLNICHILFNSVYHNNESKQIGKNVFNKLKKFNKNTSNMFIKSNGSTGIEEIICKILIRPISNNKVDNNSWKYLYNLWKPLTASGIDWRQVINIIQISGERYNIKVFMDVELLNYSGDSLGTNVKICPEKDKIIFSKSICKNTSN